VFSDQITSSAEDFSAHVISLIGIFLSLAFFAKIGACFSHEAETIISPSIFFCNDSSKFVSSQNIASRSEKIISAVTIALPDQAIKGFFICEKLPFFISTV
jgi:hypothetical protein